MAVAFWRMAALGSLALIAGAAGAAPRKAPGKGAWTGKLVPVRVYADGQRLAQDALMLKPQGRTVLPMGALFRALGADVEWNAAGRAAYAWKSSGMGVRF